MAPRGLSLDQKLQAMVDLLRTHNTFFTLKELEKLAPKEKGIIQQAVKEVLDNLADDNRIQREKIGGSNYYYCFSSQASVDAKNVLSKITAELDAERVSTQMTLTTLEEARESRIASDERFSKLAQLEAYSKSIKEDRAMLDKYGDQDPAKISKSLRSAELAREMALSHTENLSSLISHARDNFGAAPNEIRASLGLTEDFEELDAIPTILLA